MVGYWYRQQRPCLTRVFLHPYQSLKSSLCGFSSGCSTSLESVFLPFPGLCFVLGGKSSEFSSVTLSVSASLTFLLLFHNRRSISKIAANVPPSSTNCCSISGVIPSFPVRIQRNTSVVCGGTLDCNRHPVLCGQFDDSTFDSSGNKHRCCSVGIRTIWSCHQIHLVIDNKERLT